MKLPNGTFSDRHFLVLFFQEKHGSQNSVWLDFPLSDSFQKKAMARGSGISPTPS